MAGLAMLITCSSRVDAQAPTLIPPRSLGREKLLRTPAATRLQTMDVDLSGWSLHDKIGQLLIVGYRSPEQIRKLKVGGAVLFAWNLGEGIEDTRKTILKIRTEASKHLKAPLFLATDQEGGRVLRIREGMTPFPDAAAMGAMQDPYLAFRVGKAMGLELSSIGLNMNFAPVLDLGNAKSFLGNRVWGESAEGIGFPAVSFIRGQRAAGIVNVAKHYPGHGMTQVDSHFRLPQIMKTREELLREDLQPFRLAIGEGVLALMTAHVEYPRVDAGPASLSEVFLMDVLRKDLGFEGLVITDDLEMDGVKVAGSQDYGDLALKALVSGSDMILLVWSKERQEAIFRRIEKAVKSGEVSQSWLDAKVKRILRVKNMSIGLDHESSLNPYWKENLRRPETLELAQDVSEKAIRWLSGPQEEILASLRRRWDEPWTVFVPQASFQALWNSRRPLDAVVTYSPLGKDRREFLEVLQKRLSSTETGPVVVVTPPRRDLKDDVFRSLSRILGEKARSAQSRDLLWVHQGLQPLMIREGAQTRGLGVLSLYSASELSLVALQDYLKGLGATR